MSDTPDFDSMSPEEMMKWMESLAKRQGADEGFTTDADLEIDEIDEADERLAGVGEYKPFGMSDDDWAKMQAREAEEKAAKRASQAQSIPEPEPEVEPPAPEPVAEEPAVASSDGTPDFDSMSPEEMMEWMESLAARQGATEGMTTAASMQIDEIDENDERLAGIGEYKPFGMSDEDWAKMQAREAEEKAAKLARQSALTTSEDDDDDYEEYEYVDDDDDYEEYEYVDDDEEFFEYQDDSEEVIVADLADRSFDMDEEEDSEELVMADLSALGLGDDDEEEEDSEELVMADLSDLGLDDDDEEEDSKELVMADLSDLGLDDDDDEEYDSEEVAAIDFNSLISDDAFADEEPATANPMDWLASLSGQEEAEAPDLDLSMEALGEITGLGMDEAVGDPMDWLASLSGGDTDEEVPDFSALSAEDSEGSLAWMESLAASQGAPEDELVTDANLDIPMPESINEDGPGYEEFSFEDATGIVQDTDSIVPIMGLSEEDEDELVLNDPESWLDSLASGVSSNEIPDDIFDDEAFDDIPDDADEVEEFENLADSVKSQMDAGKLGDSPDDINRFFQSAFAKAATRDDVPDYIDMEDEDESEEEALGELPVQAEIPEWLQESMATMPSEFEDDDDDLSVPAKRATAEMMVADLGLDDDIDEVELPDWLQSGEDQDSGMIDLDIFDEVDEDDTLEEVFELESLDMTDTQDTWVEAFSTEDTGELAAWYDDAVASFEGNEAPVAAQASSLDVTLEIADFPIERNLAEGSPQNVPAWLGGADDDDSDIEGAIAQDEDMAWLNEDIGDETEFDMPDWLKDTVDDSITDDEDLPDWLAGEADIEPDEIPDWLRETMDEEEAVVQQLFVEDEVVVETPEPSEPLPVPVAQSPAPVPVSSDKIDAVAYLRSAKEKLNAKNLEGAMLDYEQVIRSNKALPQVEKELQRLIEDKAYKRNPSINRVLGDVLMRQGKLQDALDVYRKALNML